MQANSSLGKILLVDDDPHITALLEYNLSSEGYDVSILTEAEAAMDYDLSETRLVIVDAMNQICDGIMLLNAIKDDPHSAHVGVIICTALDSERAVIAALDAGADDYIVKPFSLRELVARVRSVIRRHPLVAQGRPTGSIINFKDLEVNLSTQTVKADGMSITLTRTEFAILKLLLKNIDNFISRAVIHRTVWNDELTAGSNERIVDTNISRLRKKLGNTGRYLMNRSGTGYAIVSELTAE